MFLFAQSGALWGVSNFAIFITYKREDGNDFAVIQLCVDGTSYYPNSLIFIRFCSIIFGCSHIHHSISLSFARNFPTFVLNVYPFHAERIKQTSYYPSLRSSA